MVETELHQNPEPCWKSPDYRCPVAVTLEVIGGKWKAVILWQLSFKTLRFSQLQRRVHGITQKMLTQQLRELERDGLVHRKVYAEVPPRVEYSLTHDGRSLQPLLQAMCTWGGEHLRRQGEEPVAPCSPKEPARNASGAD